MRPAMEKIDFFLIWPDGMRLAHPNELNAKQSGAMKKNSYSLAWDPYRVQKTIKKPLVFDGVGLHSGLSSEIELVPAPANTGIVFKKPVKGQVLSIPAHYQNVHSTCLATTLGIADLEDSKISTVEHLLAALFGLGITNLEIWVKGSEIPILDGSALPFVEGIIKAGILAQKYSTRTIRVLKPIKIYENGTICELLPRRNLRLTTSIQFNHPLIGSQTFSMDVTPENFHQLVGPARTFGFLSDVEKLRSRGLAMGASLDNVLGFSETAVMNSEGMRFSDECVRHKWLDALGDLSLCGTWVEGELVSFRGGHGIHRTLLNSLKQYPEHWQLIESESLDLYQSSSETSLTKGSVDWSMSDTLP